MFKTIFFDCDSTLSTIEGIDEVANDPTLKIRIQTITQKAMNGEMDFETAIKEKRELLKPTQKQLEAIGKKYIQNEFPGAKVLIQKLKREGATIFIVSGGFKEAITPFAEHLGIDPKNIYANLLTEDENPLHYTNGKATILQRWKMQNPNTITAFIGDGITDLATQPYVDRFIGFGGVHVRPAVKAEAEFFFEGDNMLDLYPFLT